MRPRDPVAEPLVDDAINENEDARALRGQVGDQAKEGRPLRRAGDDAGREGGARGRIMARGPCRARVPYLAADTGQLPELKSGRPIDRRYSMTHCRIFLSISVSGSIYIGPLGKLCLT